MVHEVISRDVLQPGQIAGVENLLGFGRVDAHPVDDLALFLRGGVVHVDLEQESVALSLGQRVDALVLDGVLGCHHQERLGQRVIASADRDLALGHDLEQSRLDLGRRPVDLVGEQEVTHHRAELDVELLAALPIDPGTDDVGRHQVRGELDAGEGSADHFGEGLHGQRLGDARDTLEQNVALGQQTHQDALDELVLADDDPLDLEDGPLQGLHLAGQRATTGGR